MPNIDMPLEELRSYSGSSPKPADFDVYWDRALKELETVDPAVEILPADFLASYAECFHLRFTGVRGARIYAKYLRPKTAPSEKRPAIVAFHGYSMDSGDWSGYLPYVAGGYSVFAMDCRGQGGMSEDKGGVIGNTLSGQIIRGLDDDPDNMLFRQIFLDAVELTRIAMNMPEVDPGRIGTMGASQGGALSIACSALEPRVKLAASIYPFLSDYRRVWKMDFTKNAYRELHDYFRRFDPLHKREEQIFERLGYIDVSHLAVRIRAEVLFAATLVDETCPPASQFAVYNRIESPKTMELYHDFGHEWLPGFGDSMFRFFQKL